MARQLFQADDLLDTNERGIALIMRFESFVPDWYHCPAGVWTIGYGMTENAIPGINRQTVRGPISQAQAERWLLRLLISKYEPLVERHVADVPLTSNQFSALVSFTYNVGGAAFANSTLLRKVKQQDFEGAAQEFGRWVYTNGEVLRGLVRRRQAEQALFREDDADDWLERAEAMPVHKVRPLALADVPVELATPRPV